MEKQPPSPDRISARAADFAEGMNTLACVAKQAAFAEWLRTASPQDIQRSLLLSADRLIDALAILASAERIDAVGGVEGLRREVGLYKARIETVLGRGTPEELTGAAKACLEKIADAMGLPTADRPWL